MIWQLHGHIRVVNNAHTSAEYQSHPFIGTIEAAVVYMYLQDSAVTVKDFI